MLYENMTKEHFDEEQVRLQKLKDIEKKGINPFKSYNTPTKSIGQILADFDNIGKSGKSLIIAGRIMTLRLHGGSAFANLQDETGRIQLFFSKKEVGDKDYNFIKEYIDVADFLSVKGTLFTTKKGEKTLMVKSYELLTKTILPLPSKWHGLVDTEIRYRKRYLDLISNPEVKAIFRKRTMIINYFRDFMNKEGFEEVETPIFQSIPGGATAKPFITHHNALNKDFYLRIAPELYLKRLIVGGYEKVYEIGRQFRNEGIDYSHNPEFTSFEFYWAYKSYTDLMDFTEKIISGAVQEVNKDFTVEYEGAKINFKPPYPRIKFKDVIKKEAGIDIDEYRDNLNEMKKIAKKLKVEIDKNDPVSKILDEIYKKYVREKTIQPTFIIDYPIEMEPLAKKCEDDPSYVQRFQLIANTFELLKAYTELNDPIDQLERFKEQQKQREAGNEEAQMIDYDFIEALKHGMPPTAGWGMGIDRFVALMTNSHSVKEVILFPTLKPKKDTDSSSK